MTANQINYQKYLEDVRHNLVTEEQDAELKAAQAMKARQETETSKAQAVNYISGANLNYEKAKSEVINQEILNIQKDYLPRQLEADIEVKHSQSAANYAAAYNYNTQAEFNIQKTATEALNTQIAQSKAEQASYEATASRYKTAVDISSAQLNNEYLNSGVGRVLTQIGSGIGSIGGGLVSSIVSAIAK